MLIGNHDLPNAVGRATTMEIFDTLIVPGVTVASKPGVYPVATRQGVVQIAALPWIRRSALLSREENRSLDINRINEKLQEILTGIITGLAEKIDPDIPSVLAAHVWVLNARVGSEKSMSIGQEHMLLPGSVANPAFDYVALGHIHKNQVLSSSPPVVYAGSLDRLDFGDENDARGFYLVEIPAGQKDQRTVRFEFHPVAARRFLTLRVEIAAAELDPTAAVIRQVAAQSGAIQGAIVRIEITLPEALAPHLRENDIRREAAGADYLSINRDIRWGNRLRSSAGMLEGLTPSAALKVYLESRYPPERARVLQEYGEKLVQEQSGL
jgi:DNA repair protein SbcD/Mre11